jgi:Fe2+ or Zn2+ uptake regulation protein
VKSPTELAAAFRAQGLKVTPQRQLLFALLEGDETHPTAEGLYARASTQMPGISLRTVYTTLTDLVAMGELRAVGLGAGATRFDPNIDDHHHGVCDACGAIIDVYVHGSEALVVDGAGRFAPESASIVFRGTCASCSDAVAASSPHVDPDFHLNPNPPSSKEHHHG